MKKGWTTTKLITAGSFGVIRFILWVPFVTITSVTGSPLWSIFSFFFFSFISVFSLLVVKQFGTVTIQTFIEYVLELPLPSIAFQPLLFLSAILRAIVVDTSFYLLRNREKLASVVCGGLNSMILSLLTYFIYLIMGIPGADKIPSFLFTPMGLVLILTLIFVIGALGGYLGYLIYQKKIRYTTVVKRIQGTE